jgi:hypothetical protein
MMTDPPQRATPQPPQRKVFDVMRPGRAPASATSKPIIVGHKPQVQDNSVTTGIAHHPPLLDGHRKIEINPAAGAARPMTPPAPQPQSVPPAPAQPPQPPVAPQAPAAPSRPLMPPATPVPVVPPLPAVPAPHPATPVHVVQTPSNGEEDDLLDALPAPDVAPVKEISISPHVPQPKTMWRWIIPAIIVLLVAAIILDLLLDASFITLSVPHTHFFG